MNLYDKDALKKLKEEEEKWETATLNSSLARLPERQPEFKTVSGQPVKRVYTPADLPDLDYERDLGMPGEFPFTRGVQPTMYRAKRWTMRMFAGFGSAEETNARFKYLLAHGETGLSCAFDFPTLYGRDTDDPMALGEFGKCGVGISSLADMDLLFADIPLDQITTSMTINGPAPIIWAFYIAAAEKRGIPRAKLGGTLQNDILKEYIAQNTYIFPPEPGLHLVVDTMEFGAREMPRWNTISISGYHIREAGATAVQELAFTLSDGFAYVEAGIARGLDVDDFAPRLSFFFNAHNDFFEEIAKYRAARRIWAREMKERFGAKDPRSWLMRFHTQTAGCSLSAQQPEINIVRTTIQALAAVMGGTQSLHTNSMDEALALPSDKAARIALRTQQVIAEESGVANICDPLAGSYAVEALTSETERQVYDYFAQIAKYGGVLKALESGFQQKEIASASFRYQQELEAKQLIMVGVNDYIIDEPSTIPILTIDPLSEGRQIERLRKLRAERDTVAWSAALDLVRATAQKRENIMPSLINAANKSATLGEIAGVMREVFGEYKDPAFM